MNKAWILWLLMILGSEMALAQMPQNAQKRPPSNSATNSVAKPVASPASAVRSTLPRPQNKRLVESTSKWSSVMTLGMDLRAERDQEQSTLPRIWPSIALGLGWKPWMGLLEYSTFTESSGNATLNIERKVETLLLWGQWSVREENWVIEPYFGLGLGGYRTSAELDLYGQRVGANSQWIEHAAGAMGLRWTSVSPVYASIEGRVHMNRELDPNPTLSALLRIGFILE